MARRPRSNGGQVDLKGQNVGKEVLETRKIINK
jgi:hypothetical protein